MDQPAGSIRVRQTCVYTSIYLSIYLSLSIYIYIYISVCLSVWLIVCPSVCLSICPSIHDLSMIHPSSISLYISLSLYIYIYISICTVLTCTWYDTICHNELTRRPRGRGPDRWGCPGWSPRARAALRLPSPLSAARTRSQAYITWLCSACMYYYHYQSRVTICITWCLVCSSVACLRI